VIASVKANAYGHGIVAVASELVDAGADALATASFADAVVMREVGIHLPVLLFGGVLPEAAPHLLRNDLTATVYDLRSARALSDAADRRCGVYVKVDSGLGRLGVPIGDALDFIRTVNSLPRMKVDGVYTHLPFLDNDGLEWARARLQEFDGLLKRLEQENVRVAVTQARSSPGILLGLSDACSAVAPGHLLYGLRHPAAGLIGRWPFEPVLHAIRTSLIHITAHRKEASIGVGGSYRLSAGARTGVVPFGRFHGNRPAREGQAVMLVGGRRVPVIGISLEHATLDLSEARDAGVGDEVVVLGSDGTEAITLEEIAGWQDVGLLDVLMTLDRRGHYEYVRTKPGSSVE
jgi:alanine racemase